LHFFIKIVLFSYYLGDDAMFGDAEHYKYLTNEADLNNVGDESIALTPKTPKREDSKLTSQAGQQSAQQQQNQQQQQGETTITPSNELKQAILNGVSNGANTTSLGNITMAESMDGSYYNGYDSNKNVNQIECDNIPVEARPKAAG
jgi:hypothetical protein